MNERIKELWNTAAESEDFSSSWDGQTAFMEKFAELLIRECADIALKKGMASPDTDFRTGSIVVSEYLLARFGVEE